MMTLTDKLRKAVLQAAIKGGLTEQFDTDSSVDELLEQIKAEKEKLIKEKKIKKSKPLAPISEDEIPFEIPESWRWVRLNELSSILGDGLHGTPIYSDSGEYWFINGNNFAKGKIIIKDNTKKVSLLEYEKYKKILNKNTMFISINGTLGNTAFYNNEKIILGKSACYFNLLENNLKYYLYYFFSTKCFLEYISEFATGSIIRNVSLRVMKMTMIPLPPIEEQQRIVTKIEEIFAKIDEFEKTENELVKLKEKFPREMKKALLQSAIKGELTEQLDSDSSVDELLEQTKIEKEKLIREKKIKKSNPLPPIKEDEIPFDIPDSWRWVRLGNVCCLNQAEKLENSEYKYLEVKYLRGSKKADIKNRGRFIKKGKLAILVDGENSGEVFKMLEDGYLGSTFRILDYTESINYKYFIKFLEINKNLFKNNKRGSAIPHLDKKLFSNLLMPIPPLEEQCRIVEKLEILLPICDSLEAE